MNKNLFLQVSFQPFKKFSLQHFQDVDLSEEFVKGIALDDFCTLTSIDEAFLKAKIKGYVRWHKQDLLGHKFANVDEYRDYITAIDHMQDIDELVLFVGAKISKKHICICFPDGVIWSSQNEFDFNSCHIHFAFMGASQLLPAIVCPSVNTKELFRRIKQEIPISKPYSVGLDGCVEVIGHFVKTERSSDSAFPTGLPDSLSQTDCQFGTQVLHETQLLPQNNARSIVGNKPHKEKWRMKIQMVTPSKGVKRRHTYHSKSSARRKRTSHYEQSSLPKCPTQASSPPSEDGNIALSTDASSTDTIIGGNHSDTVCTSRRVLDFHGRSIDSQGPSTQSDQTRYRNKDNFDVDYGVYRYGSMTCELLQLINDNQPNEEGNQHALSEGYYASQSSLISAFMADEIAVPNEGNIGDALIPQPFKCNTASTVQDKTLNSIRKSSRHLSPKSPGKKCSNQGNTVNTPITCDSASFNIPSSNVIECEAVIHEPPTQAFKGISSIREKPHARVISPVNTNCAFTYGNVEFLSLIHI